MVNADWFATSAETAYRLPCFDWLLAELVMVVRNGRETPVFDQRFVDGWFDRVQYVEHLRLKGFRFWVLSDVYGWMDGSSHGVTANHHATTTNGIDKRMKRLFLHWFDDVKKSREVNRTRVCSEKERSRHRIATLFLVCSKCFMWMNPSNLFRVETVITAKL